MSETEGFSHQYATVVNGLRYHYAREGSGPPLSLIHGWPDALGPQARRRFRLHWLLIRPFNGLLRRAMLRGIKARATTCTAPAQQQPERSA